MTERNIVYNDFDSFAPRVAELFPNADDPNEIAEALWDENFERAQELSGLSEEEFMDVMEELADEAHSDTCDYSESHM